MRTPAAAIAWEFRQRHRWGLTALAAYFAILTIVRIAFLQAGRVRFHDPESFAWVVVIPLSSTIIYFLAIFSFGLSGDLASRQSIYPSRMFTMPLTTHALALWPMLCGSIAMTMLWILTRSLAIWPSNAVVPVIWPAVMAASMLAWTQAFTWMPYPLRGLRVVVTVLWLASMDAIVMIALEMKARELVMLAILVPQLPLAYAVARFALSRARRGDGMGKWTDRLQPVDRLKPVLPHSSAAHAQLWFEWRQSGRTLPALVALVVPFEAALVFIFRETPMIIFEMLVMIAFTPPFMAAFVAATSGERSTSFLATRPMSDAALIAAKLKASLISTAASWIVVLTMTPIALWLSGTSETAIDWVRQLVAIMGLPRAALLLALALVALVASTWKQLVQSLSISLSGNEWLIKGSVFAALALLAVIGPVLHWLGNHREARIVLWNAFPWIAAAFVVLKIGAAMWIATPRLAAWWCGTVIALYASLAWTFSNLVIRHYLLALLAILAVPVARLSAAPLALSWSRHR